MSVSVAVAHSLPVYDWERAAAGDEADSVLAQVMPEHLAAYGQAMRRPASQDLQVPAVMVRLFAPLRRRELVARMGAAYPAHPTPAVRWHSRILQELRVGEAVRSTTRVAGKYERGGRRFLQWEVEARRAEDDAPLAVFGYVNLWEPGRPEDRQRGLREQEQQSREAPACADPPLASGTWKATMDEVLAFGDFLYPARPENPTRAGNPHIDVEYARKHIYGGITIDGNQTVAHLCELVADALPGCTVHGAGSEVDIRFPNPCRLDDVVSLSARMAQARTADGRAAIQVEARNEAGKCLAAGTITARLSTAA